jgi:hypothetical protein
MQQIIHALLATKKLTGFSADPPPPPPPPPPPGIAAHVVVTYADASGVVQSVVVQDGVTSISGVAPLILHIDASGTRSDHTSSDTEAGAWHNIGYRADYGEALGGTWPYSGLSRDQDVGPPLFGRVITQVGTRQVRVRCRNAVGDEGSVSFSVTTTAPAAPVVIPTGAGAWPAWASGTHYALQAGGDYRSLGDIITSGLDNILISKTGTGADPIVSGFRPDNRLWVNTPNLKRAANVRLLNIDCRAFYDGQVGHDFCGVINGSLGQVQGAAQEYYFDNGYSSGRTVNELNNIRYSRGTTLWNCGEIGGNSGDSYVFFLTIAQAIVQGVRLNKNNATGGAHVVRGTHFKSVWRHNNLLCTGTTTSLVKFGGLESTFTNTPADWGANNLRVGDASNGQRYPYPISKVVFADSLLGGAGQTLPNGTIGAAPQNNDSGSPREGAEFVAFENIAYFSNAPVSNFNDQTQLGGRNLSARGIRYASGGNVTTSTGVNANRIPSGWDGPYIVESTNTRPVPTPF